MRCCPLPLTAPCVPLSDKSAAPSQTREGPATPALQRPCGCSIRVDSSVYWFLLQASASGVGCLTIYYPSTSLALEVGSGGKDPRHWRPELAARVAPRRSIGIDLDGSLDATYRPPADSGGTSRSRATHPRRVHRSEENTHR